MNLMKFFGFENDEDDYDDSDDYTEDRRKKPARKENPSRQSGNFPAGRLILFKGVASDSEKKRIREAFNNGAMILVDLHKLNQREYDEYGKDFVTFMAGLAYAHEGEMKPIEPAQYIFTPRTGMFDAWPEEEIHE